jgi:hypothetical protein
MKLPRFAAEVSLGPRVGTYRGNAVFAGLSGIGVLPMLGIQCTNCEIVGGFGGIRGVGRRSCCQEVWSCDPLPCHLSQTCWSESCSPDTASSGLTFAF